MIHDAYVEVTCDREKCRESLEVRLEAGAQNTYLARTSDINERVESEGWIVVDGEHYCCPECVPESG